MVEARGRPSEMMMIRSIHKRSLARDSGVSPVVGTILMVAVTVALGATVLAIMSGVGGDQVKESSNAVFKSTAVDTDGNGKTDVIKITYISGPSPILDTDVLITIRNAAGVDVTNQTVASWQPGDFRIFNTPAGADSFFVTVSVLGTTVVDQTLMVDE